jgi:hypothetical protein
VTRKTEILRQGAELLAQELGRHGFAFQFGGSEQSSGGDFAFGNFLRAEWRLELHFRYSLGLVAYHFGSLTLSHEDYLWSVLGSRGQGQYPGFSDEPLDAFRHLASDLRTHCGAFISGDASEFGRLVAVTATRNERLSSMSGFGRLGS